MNFLSSYHTRIDCNNIVQNPRAVVEPQCCDPKPKWLSAVPGMECETLGPWPKLSRELNIQQASRSPVTTGNVGQHNREAGHKDVVLQQEGLPDPGSHTVEHAQRQNTQNQPINIHSTLIDLVKSRLVCWRCSASHLSRTYKTLHSPLHPSMQHQTNLSTMSLY